MKKSVLHLRDPHQKRIVELLDKASQSHSRWEKWSDFIVTTAISISNCVDSTHAPERAQRYSQIASKYQAADLQIFSEMLTEVVLGIEENPNCDFLGEIYMSMNFGDKCNGQFFTPYYLCLAMAKMIIGNAAQEVEEKGWTSVVDSACGSGALLVAFANTCRSNSDINYQTSVLFAAQDIDIIVGCMCYIQLSLLGCAGYVVIGNALTDSISSYDHRGLIPRDKGNVWYTPFYFHDDWRRRRALAQIIEK